MGFLRSFITFAFVLWGLSGAANAGPSLHYRIQAQINPLIQTLEANVQILRKDSTAPFQFRLHKDLKIERHSGQNLQLINTQAAYKEYQLEGTDTAIELSYSGVIFNPIQDEHSPGTIAADGVALFGSSYWYPTVPDQTLSFEISVQTPENWAALTQGTPLPSANPQTFLFSESLPQQQIYLIANRFFVKEIQHQDHLYRVYLRQNDPELADKYLKLVPSYISHYSNLIAPYPYKVFSIVENFWETGYGMPGFTLLGPTVIRLPFILTTSLPHEILHNWWGNSVYVDYEGGNWSEGLTTYLADYWQSQVQKQDRDYRMKALISFADYVNSGSDFPLRSFKGRHDSSSQAVGYSKSMMIFHMLERKIGAEAFKKGLQNFYHENLYRRASFRDLQKAFELSSALNLETFFVQWLDQTGAPHLLTKNIEVQSLGEGVYSLRGLLQQQTSQPYELEVPLRVTLQDGSIVDSLLSVHQLNTEIHLELKSRPVKIQLDPDFEIFRTILPAEKPATLSSALNADKVHFVSRHNEGLSIFETWGSFFNRGEQFYYAADNDVSLADLHNGTLVLIGDTPEIRSFVEAQLADQGFSIQEDTLGVLGQSFPLESHSSVIVGKLKSEPLRQFVWVRWEDNNDPKDWARRLTHYTTFGVLVFEGRPVVLRSVLPFHGENIPDTPL